MNETTARKFVCLGPHLVFVLAIPGCPTAVGPDAGSIGNDAGAPGDAGTTLDAGAPVDGGTPGDAGIAVDAGGHDDAGIAVDAGGHDDAGIAADAGVDAGVGPDPSTCDDVPPTGPVVYVASDGSDDTGNGSVDAPWATITYALDQVSDGSTVLVRPGTYTGRIRMRGTFVSGVTVRSEVPYQAQLRHDATVMTFYQAGAGCEGITVEGFDIAHTGPGAGGLVVHIDGAGANAVGRITLRNNVLHDSYNNDVLKINNGISDVIVERNMFFNQQGSDEHIDVNSAENVIIQDNIFFNAFAASGRTDGADTSSFIVVKDSNADSDVYTGSRDITVRRNVFLNWEGSTGSGFLLFGEDGQAFYEVEGALVENNLFVGNGPNIMRSPFGIKGCRDVVFRNNTTVGDLPANAFAFRFNREGANPVVDGIELYNNIWSDSTGTMGAVGPAGANDFSDTPAGDIATFTIDRNLYFNGDATLPEDASETINPSDDTSAIVGDPQLGSQAGLVVPHWDGTAFADGSIDICGAFNRVVTSVGMPGPGSAAVDVAEPSRSPTDDILGQPRGLDPDIGAVEQP